MARELTSKEIDGATYQFAMLNTTDAVLYSARILKMVLEPLALGLGAFKNGKPDEVVPAEPAVKKSLFDQEFDEKTLAMAARALVSSMDEQTTIEIIKKLTAETVLCGGKQISFNSHYEGRLGHLLNVLATAVEVQFGSFFGEKGVVDVAYAAIRNHVSTPGQPT